MLFNERQGRGANHARYMQFNIEIASFGGPDCCVCLLGDGPTRSIQGCDTQREFKCIRSLYRAKQDAVISSVSQYQCGDTPTRDRVLRRDPKIFAER